MGGNAFKHLGPGTSFPRMPPCTYNTLKAALLSRLLTLYGVVVVPREAHGKVDHGDLDFVVAYPREGLTHEMVAQTLCARYSVPMEGNRQSNFAIPADAPFLVSALPDQTGEPNDNSDESNQHSGEKGESVEVFYQVDVQVCKDQAQVDDHAFYLSYGGVGVLLGMLFMRVGLSFGLSGLRLPDPLPTSPPMTFYFTSSITASLAFAGLSLETWRVGFQTQRDLFDWIASSLLFDLEGLDIDKLGMKKASKDLPLSRAFALYVAAAREFDLFRAKLAKKSGRDKRAEVQERALEYFGRKDELQYILHVATVRQHAKQVFTGSLVQQWTTVQGVPIRFIMDEVKRILSSNRTSLSGLDPDVHTSPAMATPSASLRAQARAEDSLNAQPTPLEAWELALFDMEPEQVRRVVVEAKDTLNAQGKLHFDWRAAKARKEAAKKEQATVTVTPVPAS